MSIECYYRWCPHHSFNTSQDGPFCDKLKCVATEGALERYRELRAAELADTRKRKVIRLQCKNCGSQDIHRDAWAAYNQETGEWELGDIYDETVWCADCSEEGWSNIKEVKSE